METRCKPGDLAMINYDMPGCETNFGRLVIVSGPPAIDYKGQLTWLIIPVTPEPYVINNPNTGAFRFMEFQEHGIEHPDEWMTPIRIQGEIDDVEAIEDVLREIAGMETASLPN
jgi:hypothetical protein